MFRKKWLENVKTGPNPGPMEVTANTLAHVSDSALMILQMSCLSYIRWQMEF